ncbi:MAG: AAA domain-containing protein [Myxococcales bacterium]
MGQPYLRREQTADVLRYWLSSLKLEAALELRPQARRAPATAPAPRLDLPTPGQDYFKLPLDSALAGLLGQRESVRRPLDGELSAFFETWLHAQYRRAEEQGDLSQLLCFPVVHMPRGELAGLLRCGVRLRFGRTTGEAFRVPSFAERQRGQYPAPPQEVLVSQSARQDGAWPFFVDTRLLNQTLGVPSEAIDALFDGLRALDGPSETQMLALVLRTLEGALPADASARAPASPAPSAHEDAEALLEGITGCMRTLLERANSRAQVYAVGIVLDGTQAKTTWHLQRDLRELLESEPPERLRNDRCLGAYLAGRPLEGTELPQQALFPGPVLTAHQRRAAEHFWGSRFTSVEGPPGTGKTTLILHLCAEALLGKIARFVEQGVMDDALLLITSSNNRAVDNVLEGLGGGAGLPLALRAGSRQICEQVLVHQLRQVKRWLEQAEAESREQRQAALAHAVERFRQLRARMEPLYAPRLRALGRRAERDRVREELAEAVQRAAEDGQALVLPGDALELPDGLAQPLRNALLKLEQRLVALSKLCEASPGLAQLNAVARHYGRTADGDLPVFEAALSAARLALDLPLPPLVAPLAPRELMDAWEDATERSLTLLGELRERLDATRAHAQRSQQRAERARTIEGLRERLAKLEQEAGDLPEVVHDAALSCTLFADAVSVREAWAKAEAGSLREAVVAALDTLESDRSLRPLYRDQPQHARTLQRLFGVWGSTLLSLANCFPSAAGSIARVVIDEAGQCHPAHAISALMRCDAALVIGDTKQLTPVIELSADEEARLLQSCGLRPEPWLEPYRLHTQAWVSTQSLAERAVQARHTLIDHFRCQPEIIEVSDALCGYGLRVHTPRATRAHEAPFLAAPLSWVDLEGQQESLGGSLCNQVELREVVALVRRLLTCGISACDVAVITPYRGQLELLRRAFAHERVPLEYSPELVEGHDAGSARASSGLALGTVHRFQGGERSIVLFTSVVTRAQSLGFLNARPNLLNVAVSRARHHFVALGHRGVMGQGARTRLLSDAAHPLSRLAYAT